MPQVAPVARRILANIEKVILGKRSEIVLALVAYFCEGHILLEDVPGVVQRLEYDPNRYSPHARVHVFLH